MWRLLLNILSYTAAGIFACISFLIILDLVTLAREDRKLLEEFKLRVDAVEQFEAHFGRLPEEQDLPQLWSTFQNAPGNDFHISTVGDIPWPRRGGRILWPASGGWVLWDWLGESSEYYTSWNRHYSLNQSMSWFAIEGWYLFSPLLAVFFIFVPYLTRKKEPNRVA